MRRIWLLTLFLLTASGLAHAQGLLLQTGFEVPDLGTGTNAYQYRPAGSAWTWAGSAGLAGNGSGFTSQNPNAPEGDQVAFLQSAGSLSQTFNVAPGRYRVSFRASQRQHGGVNNQEIAVRLDGVEIERIRPVGTSYAAYATVSFQVTSGSHTLQLLGKPPATGDHTAFVDRLELEALTSIGKLWSSPATWGGAVPDGSTDAVIPAGQIVLLDMTAKVKTLQVDGELYCVDKDLKLSAEVVMVHGRFECGSPASPFLNSFEITLTGPVTVPVNPAAMGERVLGSMMGGRIELHGKPRTSWTQLGASLAVGATSLTTAIPVDWQQGEKLVLAPSRHLVHEGEVVTITQRLSSTLFTITPTLYPHWGQAPTTHSANGHTWTLDERAEVGLLTRNLRIQGDADADSTGLGGHLMTMAGTVTHVSGVELFRMGQRGQLGRYPFHWHMLGSAPGQSIVNSSIHRSFNRCVTVHGTHDTRVADNVCYDFIGHGYFLEDGIEERNVFDRNLAIWAKKPQPGQQVVDPDLLDTDSRSGVASSGPAAFWIGHPNNTYTRNVAAGSQGTGFWYGMQDTVGEPSKTYFNAAGVNPRLATFGVFDDNRAHSNRQGFSSCRDDGGPFGMEPPNEALLTRLVANHNEQGVWPCATPQDRQNHRVVDLVVANSPNGMQAPNPMTFEDSLFVAYSANTPPGALATGGVDWRAIQVYDQGFLLDNVRFVNYHQPAMTVFFPGSGAHKLTQNRAQAVSFDNSPNLFLDPDDFSRVGNGPALWGDVVHDLDGSLYRAGWAIVPDHPMMFDSSCEKPLGKKLAGYACPYRYVQFRAEHFTPPIDSVTVIRQDGFHNSAPHTVGRFLTELPITEDALYSWRYSQGMRHNRIDVSLHGAFPGDTPVYELLDVPPTVAVVTPGWSPAADVSDLLVGAGRRWFYRQGSLFLKMAAVGADWHAKDLVRLCMTGPGCSAGLLNLGSLPSVTITAPADGARFPVGAPIQVDATLSDPDGIRAAYLYLGTAIVGADRIAPYSWTLTGLAPGAYPVKLVAEDTTGRTFTAVQQLFVGEPTPRVDITSLVENGTYLGSAPLNVAFNVINWTVSPGGTHLRLIVDDLDLGPLFSTAPTTIPNLAQGEHEIEVALALADGTATAMVDRVKVYLQHQKVIADFEDGVDGRGSLAPEVPGLVGVSEIGSAWGTADPVASRADGEDDINWWDIVPIASSPNGFATYRLKLEPAQSWVGSTHLEITSDSPPFEAFVEDAQQGLTSLGVHTGYVTTLALPANTTLIDQVVAIRLRYNEAQMTSNPARQHLRRVRLLP